MTQHSKAETRQIKNIMSNTKSPMEITEQTPNPFQVFLVMIALNSPFTTKINWWDDYQDQFTKDAVDACV
jgi:hypothetical protein